jgi:hypothetical protein
MKSIKQILSEANYMIELSEQSPQDINAELAARLKAAEKRIAELMSDEDSWDTSTRADEMRALLQSTKRDADERVKTFSPPTFEIDMNKGLGKLPGMDLGFEYDLNIPEDEPVKDSGWGFGKSDPYYFDLDTPRWEFND